MQKCEGILHGLCMCGALSTGMHTTVYRLLSPLQEGQIVEDRQRQTLCDWLSGTSKVPSLRASHNPSITLLQVLTCHLFSTQHVLCSNSSLDAFGMCVLCVSCCMHVAVWARFVTPGASCGHVLLCFLRVCVCVLSMDTEALCVVCKTAATLLGLDSRACAAPLLGIAT